MDTSVDLHAEEVVFEGDFIPAAEFANSEVLRYYCVGLFEICRACPMESNDLIDHY